jgi:hypothetical protein
MAIYLDKMGMYLFVFLLCKCDKLITLFFYKFKMFAFFAFYNINT